VKCSNLCENHTSKSQTDRQTVRRTDGQTTYCGIAALCVSCACGLIGLTELSVILVIIVVKAKFSTTASSKAVSTAGQPEINMAANTRNANGLGTTKTKQMTSKFHRQIYIRFSRASRGIQIECRPSVCLVSLSVCDVDGSGSHTLEILETNCTDN